MKDFVTYLAKSLAQYPEDVVVNQNPPGDNGVVLELTVSENDVNHLIGKQGRTVKAMRTLLAVAGTKKKQRYFLKIISDKIVPESSPEKPDGNETSGKTEETA